MKNNLLLLFTILLIAQNAFAVGPGDAIWGVTSIMSTVTQKEKAKAYIRNMDAQTECIKEGKCTVINNYKGGEPDYDSNTADERMADFVADYFERKNAKAKLKEIKQRAKIENDAQTLELIKKYKKAGAVVTLQQIEENKNSKNAD